MKKICYVTTVPGTLRAFVLKSAEYLHSTGEFDISFISNPDVAFAAELPEYIHYYPIRMTRGMGKDGLRVIKEMWQIFRREKFDLVQYSTPNASCYASIAARLARIPVRLYCQWGMVYIGFSGIKRKVFKAIEKMVCRNSTWIEPDSHSNLKFAHDEGLYPENKGSVVWNGSACGVSLDKFDIGKKSEYRTRVRDRHAIPQDAFVFGFMGRINGDKGINELFTSMRRLLVDYPDAYLMIVGRSEVSRGVDTELFQWAQDCPQVVFTGHTRTPEQYMAAMDCFVLPSYREGFGTSILEAEAMAVPVISTRIPGPVDAMQKDVTGLMVEKKDAEGLLQAMTAMINSPEQRAEFGRQGHLYAAEKFNQKIMFEKIYEDRVRLLK